MKKEVMDKERIKQKSGFINRSEKFPSGNQKGPVKGDFFKEM